MYYDQLGLPISLPKPPQRIISLVPSQTELLVDLGLKDQIVGITKFCVHPRGLLKEKTIIGGTKNYRLDVIESLAPDLVIGNKEENDRSTIEELAKTYPVWMSDIYSLKDSLDMIERLGEIFLRKSEAKRISDQLRGDFMIKPEIKGKAVYLIWNKPLMAAGSNTFINEMLPWAGFENVIKRERYPEISKEDLKELNPDYILLSSEPFPFKKKHLDDFASLFPEAKIQIVDGEMFSWYGSRLLRAREYFGEL